MLKSLGSRRLRSAALAVLLLGGVTVNTIAATPAYAAGPTYIFPTFKGDAAADQELWVYTGTSPTSLNLLADTNYYGPTGALRDPSIIRHPNGLYYMAFTNGSWAVTTTSFEISSSPDLVHWNHVTTIPAGVAGTEKTWAPEFFVEGSTIRIITSLASSSNQFTPYVYTAQDSSLTSWSAPVPLGVGTNHIDTAIIKAGSLYHAFIKDETTKVIEHWTSGNFTSWDKHDVVFSGGHEGASIFRQADGTFRIFADRYPNSGMFTKTSSDLWTWSAASAVNCSGCRHGTVLLDDDYSVGDEYRLTNLYSGKVVDVPGSSSANGTLIKSYTWNGGSNQKWNFQVTNDGYYRLVNENSGKCLDVSGGSTADGADIIQWTCTDGSNQQFAWQAYGNGFRLVARHSGKCVDLFEWDTSEGAVFKQWSCNGNPVQQFTRTAV
jgi:hypothetical protein